MKNIFSVSLSVLWTFTSKPSPSRGSALGAPTKIVSISRLKFSSGILAAKTSIRYRVRMAKWHTQLRIAVLLQSCNFWNLRGKKKVHVCISSKATQTISVLSLDFISTYRHREVRHPPRSPDDPLFSWCARCAICYHSVLDPTGQTGNAISGMMIQKQSFRFKWGYSCMTAMTFCWQPMKSHLLSN